MRYDAATVTPLACRISRSYSVFYYLSQTCLNRRYTSRGNHNEIKRFFSVRKSTCSGTPFCRGKQNELVKFGALDGQEKMACLRVNMTTITGVPVMPGARCLRAEKQQFSVEETTAEPQKSKLALLNAQHYLKLEVCRDPQAENPVLS